NDTKWKVDGQTGYFGLCAAITRALKKGVDVTNSKVYSKFTEEELLEILKSDDGETVCPLIKERVECLRQVGSKLLEKYDGRFENCVKICNNESVKLLDLIVTEFPCFADEATFKDKRVSLYKRAQILIGDLWACFEGQGIGYFKDIDQITMFPDYRVPQVLVHFKSLEVVCWPLREYTERIRACTYGPHIKDLCSMSDITQHDVRKGLGREQPRIQDKI
uniref:Queuosine 5'-phosphate N-glycosylase/hydrolase n=1 Tax=Megaselia scalaris TaxID=36166 RepID=T1GD32_MEGSC